MQLFEAAKLAVCSGGERLIVLLLDEMYIREDLVYNKQSGKLIGFVDIGEVNNHLLKYERVVKGEQPDTPPIAKSVMSFMVRGLFTSLRFPYAHFPCHKLTGELLIQPFWEAVYRLERMGLKVFECI